MAPLLAIIVIACLSAGMLALIFTTGSQQYPGFIVGYIAFSDYNKAAEQRWFLLGLVVLVGVSLLLSCWRHKRATDTDAAQISSTARGSFFALVPMLGKHGEIFSWLIAGAALSRSFVYGRFDTLALVAIAAATVLLLAERFAARWSCRVEAGLVAVVGTFVSCVGVLTAIVVVGGANHALDGSARLYGVLLACTTAGIVAALCRSDRRIALVRATQIFSPLVLLKFLGLESVGLAGSAPWRLNLFGFLLIVLIVVGAVVLALVRCVASTREELPLVSPALLLGAASLCAFTLPEASTLSIDPYHLGELVLPWHQLVELRQRPYVDFVPIQGFMSLAQGLVNTLFYDGSVAQLRAAHSLLLVGLASLFVGLTAMSLGRGAALVLAPLALPFLDQFCLVGSSIVLLSWPRLLSNPSRWLAVAVATVAVAACWNAPTGLALCAATTPIGVWMLSKALPMRAGSSGLLLPALIVALACLWLLPITGVVSFVAENGPVNTVQHAFPWIQDWSASKIFPRYFASPQPDRIVWETLRVGGWMLAVALLVTIQLRVTPLRNALEFGSSAFLAGGALFALLMFPYSMSRIDGPPHLSRTGALSMVALGFFVPAAFLYCERYLQRLIIHPLFVGFMIGIPLAWKGYSLESFLQFPTVQAKADSTYVLTDSKESGMHNLGRGYVPSGVLDEYTRLNQALSLFLDVGEGYVDLTNHSVHAALLNRRFLGIYAGANAVGSRIQRRILERFESEPPAVVVVHPLIMIDEASIPLRNYLIFRWLMRKGYQWYEDRGYGFLVHPRRAQERALQTSTDLLSWRERLIVRRLKGIPRAWGKSYSSLSALVEEHPLDGGHPQSVSGMKVGADGWVEYTGAGAWIDVPLSEQHSASPADYLLLEFDRSAGASTKPILGVSFPDTPGGDTVFQFWGGDSPLIVPVGADPLWQQTRVSRVRIHIIRDKMGSAWRLRTAKLLRLKEP